MCFARRCVGFGAIILVLTQTSCTESLHPVGDPADAKTDPQLFGHWKPAKVKAEFQQHYFGLPRARDIQNAPAGLMEIYEIKLSQFNELEWSDPPAYAFVVTLGKDRYLHLIERGEAVEKKLRRWNPAGVKSYSILKYSIQENHLTFWPMNLDATANLVDSGKLQGKATRFSSKTAKSVTLTEPTGNLRKFLETGGNKTLFPDAGKLVFERVEL